MGDLVRCGGHATADRVDQSGHGRVAATAVGVDFDGEVFLGVEKICEPGVLRYQEQLGRQPRFTLLLCATADSRSAHRSRLTLESLSNRVHGNWRLDISADQPAAAASCRRLIKECPGLAYGKILTANAAALYYAP
ncbi:hypothetical protein [Mycobacterium terramassiliense]|uniref:hypothetical protein n=1 Tax=Mycobacterium terramassiliense TaxID=1841859 RepID=UPI0012FFA443|nr:hypothetical protein [Mycobacterium terramassiliense]